MTSTATRRIALLEYGTIVSTRDIASSTPSPYVLLPGDNLVFGIDAGISATPVSGTSTSDPQNVGWLDGFSRHNRIHQISGSQMFIQSGSASITLFGSMIKHGKEKLFELNQPLTSPAIHEALHFDNPAVDQFNVSIRNDMSGSYTSNLVLGIMMNDNEDGHHRNPDFNTKAPFSNVPRAVYESIHNGGRISDRYYNQNVGTFTYPNGSSDLAGPIGIGWEDKYGLRYWNNLLSLTSHQSRLLNSVKLRDVNERFYDTIMPSIADYCDRAGMDVTDTTVTGTMGGQFTESGSIDNPNRYPFPYATDVTRPIFEATELYFELTGSGVRGQSGATVAQQGKIFRPLLFTLFDPLAINALLFKKGGYFFSWDSGVTNTTVVAEYGPHHDPWPHQKYTRATGYAYGIMDIRRRFSSAVFRSDRFGQFRDMLEQRQSAKFYFTGRGDPYVNSQNSMDEFSDATVGFGEGESPVQCRFVAMSDGLTVISPYDTDSSNMSLEATSSIPVYR